MTAVASARPTPSAVTDFIQKRQPFVLEARVSPTASAAGHQDALNILNREANRVRHLDSRWIWEPDYEPQRGRYRLHFVPIDRVDDNSVTAFVSRLAGSIIMGTLLGALGSQR
jgi:hypothetical protein